MSEITPIVSIKNLTKRYGDFVAVGNLSLEIARGEIFGFLGVNGAGKTTTLRILSGILKPTSGEVFIDGFSMDKEPLQAKQVTGFIPDRPYLYSKLTGREFLYFVSDLYGVSSSLAEARIDQLLGSYSLNDWQNELIESYSHGMKQRLTTCAALIHNPKLLIVDEPMVGLDPHGAKFLKESFKQYAKEGMSILLSTHSLNVAEELADRIGIIHKGELLTVGTLSEIRALTGGSEEGLENIFLKLTASH